MGNCVYQVSVISIDLEHLFILLVSLAIPKPCNSATLFRQHLGTLLSIRSHTPRDGVITP